MYITYSGSFLVLSAVQKSLPIYENHTLTPLDVKVRAITDTSRIFALRSSCYVCVCVCLCVCVYG
jgi:hypothetical protein